MSYTEVTQAFLDLLKGMVTVGKKICLYNANSEHELTVDECGLRLIIPAMVIKPTESVYEVAAQGLWGGKFVFPEDSKLVSGVCYISIANSCELNDYVTVELEHCAEVIDERQTQYLSFVVAKSGPPFKFEYLPGGSFSSQSQYGTISLKRFSLLFAIVVIGAADVLVGGASFGVGGAVVGAVTPRVLALGVRSSKDWYILSKLYLKQI